LTIRCFPDHQIADLGDQKRLKKSTRPEKVLRSAAPGAQIGISPRAGDEQMIDVGRVDGAGGPVADLQKFVCAPRSWHIAGTAG
jgi:hypothetical protein